MISDISQIQEAINICEAVPACNKTWIQIQNQPIKEMKKLDLHLAGSRHIRDDNGLTFYSVTGNQQSGKSAYGMCILSELYQNDVDEVMEHIVMSAKDFTNIIDKALTEGFRHKCIMWDDASVTGSAATWMTNPKLVMYLAALGDTLAVATKSIILSSPSGDMIKAFRSYQKYIIQINKGRNKYDRIARAYYIGRSPMAQRWCSSVFEDCFDTRIPFYERYAAKRKEISLAAVRNMKEMFSDQQEEDKSKPVREMDRIIEKRRDWEAGVYEEKYGYKMPWKTVVKKEGFNPGYAKNVISMY